MGKEKNMGTNEERTVLCHHAGQLFGLLYLEQTGAAGKEREGLDTQERSRDGR